MIQLIINRSGVTSIWFAGTPKVGDAVWVRDAGAARHLLEEGICVWPGGEAGVGPLERPTASPVYAPSAGPTELKSAAPAPATQAGGASPLLARTPAWPLDRFSVISERAWAGEVICILGGGPSLRPEIAGTVKGRARVIAINNSYLLAPWADLLYFADYRWWHDFGHKDKPAFKDFKGQKVTIQATGALVTDPDVHMLHNYGSDGLSDAPNGINTGSNGGHQALNIAYLARARRILLLGYDMRYVGRRSHWHGGHPITTPESQYTNYVRNFNSTLEKLKARSIEVLNCTPDSALKAFPAMPLEQALELP